MNDLRRQRKKVSEIITRSENIPIMAETMIEVKDSPRKALETKLKTCAAYIGIFHRKWGYIPKNDNPDQL